MSKTNIITLVQVTKENYKKKKKSLNISGRQKEDRDDVQVYSSRKNYQYLELKTTFLIRTNCERYNVKQQGFWDRLGYGYG